MTSKSLSPTFPLLSEEKAVSLPLLLRSRDCRQARQQQWVKRDCSLISLTLVTPGAIKDNAVSRTLFTIACQQIQQLLQNHQLDSLQRWRAALVSGPEALWLVNSNHYWLKTLCYQLEEQHPLGRLWDIDIIADDGQSITRSMIGQPARRCLVCQQSAVVCARAQRHGVEQLQDNIKEMLHDYYQQ